MKKILNLFILGGFVMGACSACAAKSALDQNRNKWKAADITRYRFTLDIRCFCAFRNDMPLTIEVEDNDVLSIKKADGSLVLPSDSTYTIYFPYGTMDGTFFEIEAGLSGEVDEVKADYDPVYGYPVDVFIDPQKSIADDELSIHVSNFEIIK